MHLLTPYYTVILDYCLNNRGQAVDIKNYVPSQYERSA